VSVKVSGVSDADGRGYALSVTGLQELRRDLVAFDKTLVYKLSSRFRRIGNVVAGDAKVLTGRLAQVQGDKRYEGRVPSALAEQADTIAAGIKVKMGGSRSNRSAAVRVVQMSPIGAMLEFASTPKSSQGRALIKLLDRRAEPGRFVWEATDARKPFIFREVAAAVAKAEAELNAGLGI
jgi:chorismate mutase